MTRAFRRLVALILVTVLAACGEPNRRLDEYVFYDGPEFRLKVVRYYRNIPFSHLGEHAVVMCRSENTGDYPGTDKQDAGWRPLGPGDARGSKDAREVALRLKDDYPVFDDRTLIAKTNAFNISFDACGSFTGWDPARLPPGLIDVLDKPDSCAPHGPQDCRYFDFEGDRQPRYEQIMVGADGAVGFTVKSAAFRGVDWLRVRTGNRGAVWHVEGASGEAGGQPLPPDSVQSLSMTSLEKGLADSSLMAWLESSLPRHSMVIWPHALVACGTRLGGGQTAGAACAEILFSDSQGNSGALYIAMGSEREAGVAAPVFLSGVYSSGGKPERIESLAGLRERLAARIN